MTDTDGWLMAAEATVPPDWIDYNGHMNVAYYTMAFDRALDEIYDRLGIGPALVESDRMGPMALQTQIHYRAELLEGARFRCAFLLLDHDHKRVHVFLRMLTADGEVAATYESLTMNVDLEARRSAPFPEDALAGIAALAERQAAIARPPEAGARIGIRRR